MENVGKSNVLDRNFEMSGKGKEQLQEKIKIFSEETKWMEVDPMKLIVYSIRKREDDRFSVLRLRPVDMTLDNIISPRTVKDGKVVDTGYFSAENKTVGFVYDDSLRDEYGLTNSQIDDLAEKGCFLKYGTTLLLPSDGFMTSLCKKLGLGGQLSTGIDPMRDIFVASRLGRTENRFKILCRCNHAEDKAVKAFSCFSIDTSVDTPDIVFDYIDQVEKDRPIGVDWFEIGNEETQIELRYASKDYGGLNVGCRLTYSDIGEASNKIEDVVYTSGEIAVLPNGRSWKKNATTDAISEFLIASRKNTEKLPNVSAMKAKHVDSVRDTVETYLKKAKFDTVLCDTKRQKVMDFLPDEDEAGTLYDVFCCITQIPAFYKRVVQGIGPGQEINSPSGEAEEDETVQSSFYKRTEENLRKVAGKAITLMK